jgi:hypothetical protein
MPVGQSACCTFRLLDVRALSLVSHETVFAFMRITGAGGVSTIVGLVVGTLAHASSPRDTA